MHCSFFAPSTPVTNRVHHDFPLEQIFFGGRQFVQALHRKCLIFPGTLSFQIPDHKSLVAAEFETEALAKFSSSQMTLYANFTVYTPSFSNAQYRKSAWEDTHRGMDLIYCASKGLKHESSIWSFHPPTLESINSATLASLSKTEGMGVTVLLSSQQSLKI